MNTYHSKISYFRQTSNPLEEVKRPISFRDYHGRAGSLEDRSSISSCNSSEQGFSRTASACMNNNKRSFLRKKIVELKELEGGIRKGYRVVCFPHNPQLGTIKWLGIINQVTYLGVEFDQEIGNNFPETKGAPPFPCNITHGRLVLVEDLVVASDPTEQTLLMENYPVYDNLCSEFTSKLDDFYQFCTSAEDSLNNLGGELDASCSIAVKVEYGSIALALERHKSYLGKVEESYALIDWCNRKFEELSSYSDHILPSEERKINRTIQELTDSHANIESKLKRRIKVLEQALENCQIIKEFLNNKLDWLRAAKVEIRKMEWSPIKSEKDISDRISTIQQLLTNFCLDESEEMSDILDKLSEIHEINQSPELNSNSNEELPNNKYDSELDEIISLRASLLKELQFKYQYLKEARKILLKFSKGISVFEKWYYDHLRVVCELGESIINFDTVKEREEKRQEFLEILETARKLRVSIFHPSILDDRIQDLQIKWRTLMEQCYRGRFSRKTL